MPPPARADLPDAAAPAAKAAEPGDASFVAWTDPAGVDALLRGQDLPASDKDPRGCNFDVPEQSCIPGSAGVNWACRNDCASGCESCASDCRAKLAGCHERACAAEPARCVQACLTTRDRCASQCVAQVAAYEKEVRENYGCKDKRAALEICKRATACLATCDAKKTPDACRAACKKTHAAGCNEHFMQQVDFGNCNAYEDPI
jgi:hypothetical protein